MPLRNELEAALGDAYTLVGELGGAGMSRMFVAEERALRRAVVIKVLPPDLSVGMNAERFNREVLLAARLQHPHIVPVLASGQVGGVPWYTMPLVDGQSLRDRLHSEARLLLPESISILRDVAKALAYAHAQGIVHRDIKPANVMLAGGSAMVIDFGIAKALTQHGPTEKAVDLTQDGVAIGTPAYMAPEQVSGYRDIDHRADIYSFGAMAFEMFTGSTPFLGLTASEQRMAHLKEQPDAQALAAAQVPSHVAELIVRCLAKRPDQRPQSAAELLAALDVTTSAPAASVATTELARSRHSRGGRGRTFGDRRDLAAA
jgi:serine/threonine protein kinase